MTTEGGGSALDRMLAVPSGEEQPIEKLFNMDNIKMKSEIPPGLILQLARAYTIAEIVKDPRKATDALNIFINNILILQISKDRKGRIEWLEAAVARMRRDTEDD